MATYAVRVCYISSDYYRLHLIQIASYYTSYILRVASSNKNVRIIALMKQTTAGNSFVPPVILNDILPPHMHSHLTIAYTLLLDTVQRWLPQILLPKLQDSTKQRGHSFTKELQTFLFSSKKFFPRI